MSKTEGEERWPVKWEVECPECNYSTVLWGDGDRTPECPECNPELDIHDLTQLSGIGGGKAEALIKGGKPTLVEVVGTSQEQLAEIPGIGNALSARVKADVGHVHDPHRENVVEHLRSKTDIAEETPNLRVVKKVYNNGRVVKE